MMPVYPWEQKIIEIARSWPRNDLFFSFMHGISDFSITVYFIFVGLAFAVWRLGWRKVVTCSTFSGFAVLLSEIVSRRVIKPFVMRPRPDYVGLDCHMNACWGFVSSHATNVFSVAVFLTLYDRRNAVWAIPVAATVAFSRIYLVDHFPLDVIGGAIIGALIGLLVWLIFRFFISRFNPLSWKVAPKSSMHYRPPRAAQQ
jgi:membrane-associated phospholipid phosphatase